MHINYLKSLILILSNTISINILYWYYLALKCVRCLKNIGIRVAGLLINYTNLLSFRTDIDNFFTMFYIIKYIIYIIQCNISMKNSKKYNIQ